MAVYRRALLIASFAASIVLYVLSKVATGRDRPVAPDPALVPLLLVDGFILLLHTGYLVQSRDETLVSPVAAYERVTAGLGPAAANLYVRVQLVATVVCNLLMALTCADILVSIGELLFQVAVPEGHLRVVTGRTVALLTGALLTALNCWSPDWTTATFAVYVKSLFMSYWAVTIATGWGALHRRLETIRGVVGLTFVLALVLILVRELRLFPVDVVASNQVILLPYYERLSAVHGPELSLIAACYYAGSLNDLFLTVEPFVTVSRRGALPAVLGRGRTPAVLLVLRSTICCALVLIGCDDVTVVMVAWNGLLLFGGLMFDLAVTVARCQGKSQIWRSMASAAIRSTALVAHIVWFLFCNREVALDALAIVLTVATLSHLWLWTLGSATAERFCAWLLPDDEPEVERRTPDDPDVRTADIEKENFL